MGNQKLPELLFKLLSKTFHKTKKAISVPFYPDMGLKGVLPKNRAPSIFADQEFLVICKKNNENYDV